MTIRFSTDLARVALEAMATRLAGGTIEIYSGNPPQRPDEAVAGVLLARVTQDAGSFTEGVATNGLNFVVSAEGVLSKEPSENWKYMGLVTGTARWFRLRGNPVDAGDSSSAMPRIDGTVGGVSGDMRLSAINITAGAPGTVDRFELTKKVVA